MFRKSLEVKKSYENQGHRASQELIGKKNRAYRFFLIFEAIKEERSTLSTKNVNIHFNNFQSFKDQTKIECKF